MIKFKIKKSIKILFIFGIIIAGFFSVIHFTLAADKIQLNVPIFTFTEATDMADYILTIYQSALYIIVPLLILIIMYAGTQWMSSGFNEGQKAKAKKNLLQGFIGLGIVLFSYVLLSVVGIKELRAPDIMHLDPGIIEGEFDLIELPMAGSEGGAMLSEVPHLYQCDYKSVIWDGPGGNRNVCSSGCGLTSTTMVLQYYGKKVTVPEAAKWTVANGYRKVGQRGMTFEGIAAMAKWQGLNFKIVSNNFEAIKASVMDKKPVIILVHGPCKFTKGGHYIVLAGWDGNQFIVNDPGSHSAARTHGTWAEIAQGCSIAGAGSIYQ